MVNNADTIMENESIYWIWLEQVLGVGSRKIKDVYEGYQSAKNFYDLGDNIWKLSGYFSPAETSKLQKYDFEQAKNVVTKCNYLGIDIIALNDKKYPQKLRNIPNPPSVLYVKGDLSCIDDMVCIAMVGTRSATKYGLDMAFKLSFDLIKLGACVVSGGALGIDTAAHKGAVQAGGKTVLVMGCGLNYNYIPENISMRREILECGGALVSEYPPDCPSIPRNFPLRNRLISGLSQGTLVVEAGQKSGSLITANYTLEQNRDLYALPGNITSSVSMGTNSLIKECAKPVTCAVDIMEEYLPNVSEKQMSQIKEREAIKKEVVLTGVSDLAKDLYGILKKEPYHIDDLASKLKISVSSLLMAITELEIGGFILSHAGKRYSKV